MTTQISWTIGELASHVGLSVKAVRYYSDLGLLPEAARSAGGHRRFGADAPDRLRLIRRLRSLGMPMASVTEAVSGGRPLADVVDTELGRVQERLDELRWRRATLQALDRSGSDELLLNRLAALARVQEVPRAQEELERHWLRALPAYLPRRLSGIILAQAIPELPADPSPEVVLAFAELRSIVEDPGFVWAMFAPASLDVGYLYAGLHDAYDMALEARRRASAPRLNEALNLLVHLSARCSGLEDSPDFRRFLLRSVEQRPLARRYWSAITTITGDLGLNVGSAHFSMIDELARVEPTREEVPAIP